MLFLAAAIICSPKIQSFLTHNTAFTPLFSLPFKNSLEHLPRLYSAVNAAIKLKNTIAIALKPSKITVGNWTTHRRIIKYDVRRRARFNKKYPERKIEYLISCTVNKPNELECLVKLGIGGIQTDCPESLQEIAIQLGRKIR